jgi:two-component system response regulator FixJ
VDFTTYVVDDDEAVRMSLAFLLRTETVRCRTFESARAFLEQVSPADRGCVITDVRMPGMDGISLVRHLQEHGVTMPVIVITGHADVPLAVQALKAGAADFIEKPFQGDAIIAAVRKCLETARQVDEVESRRLVIERREAMLTDRERQIYTAVTDGLSNKEIGLALQISPRTVEIHRANVMSKMQAEGLPELVRMKHRH